MLNQSCLAGLLSSMGLLLAAPAIAQIAADRSAGSSVRRNGSNVQIEGGTQRGQNLFHSFRQFNVQQGERVTLTDPGVSNILLRVTGSRSTIDGTLAVGGDANLFLLNPRGIVFGRNAALDVRGSFVATTADAIRFGNQGSFSATAETPGLLTVNPSAFLFNPTPHGSIVNRASPLQEDAIDFTNLRVPDGNSFLLLGGEVRLEGGGLIALGGQIQVGGIVGEGTVDLRTGNELRLAFDSTTQRADVSLGGGSQIVVAGGELVINANSLQILDGSQLSANTAPSNVDPLGIRVGNIRLYVQDQINIRNSFISSEGERAVNAGQLVLQAGRSILLDGATIATETFSSSSAGQIRVIAPQILTNDGSLLTARTNSGGNAGDIIIQATDRLLLDNSTISSAADENSTGDAGLIALQTNQLTLTDSSIFTDARATAGTGGSITIDARSIQLSGTELSASTVATNGGNITITGAESLSIDRQSQISTSAGTNQAGGNGGNITIDARFIVADPFSNSDITANAFQGNGGRVEIQSNQIFGLQYRQSNTLLSDITASSEFGNAGTVLINGLEADPSRSLAATLPTAPADTSTQIAQTCGTAIRPIASDETIRANRSTASGDVNEFIVTGRGGVPPAPTDYISSEGTIVGWARLPDAPAGNSEAQSTARQSARADRSPLPEPSERPDLTEAQGWIVDAQGRVVLVAHAPANGSANTSTANSGRCGGRTMWAIE